jgi:REP element-mobilizing transposase RayT
LSPQRKQGKFSWAESFMSAIAYHLVWTTYGTWLHGEVRGWVEKNRHVIRPPDSKREALARGRMAEQSIVLSSEERAIVDDTIHRHCQIRNWCLHALNVRSNHVHLVATADRDAALVMNELKAWCSRKLSDAYQLTVPVASNAGRRRWFTEGGDKATINDEAYFQNAIKYVLEGQ